MWYAELSSPFSDLPQESVQGYKQAEHRARSASNMASSLYHLANSLDPEIAKQLTDTHATLLLLDVPDGTLLGVDQHTFGVGPKFKGVKMIPPGTHFICSRAVSLQSQSVGPATGFFVHLAAQQVLVYRWDPSIETIMQLQDDDEAQRYIAGVRRYDFDTGLAPYNLPAHAAWSHISDHITPSLIRRLSPPSGIISITAEGQDAGLSEPRTAAEHKLAAQLSQAHGRQAAQQQAQHSFPEHSPQGPRDKADSNDMAVDSSQQPDMDLDASGGAMQGDGQPAQQTGRDTAAGRCNYTPLPRHIKQSGATAAELTALNMDKSAILQTVVSAHFQGKLDGLIGELQYAFIAFVYGTSLDGYAQWKAILLLLLGCEHAALHDWQPQFVKALKVIQCQLSIGLGSKQAHTGAPSGSIAMPFGESLVEELLPDSFLRRMFGSFFNMLQENSTQVGPALFQAASQLKELLGNHLGWDFGMQVLGLQGEGDGDEDGPVLVEDPNDLVRL